MNGRSGAAVKIYDSRLRIEREEKVRAMVHGGFAAQTDLVAYPREVVSDRGGNFLGFLMQLVSGYRPVHELYSPKSRQRHFPKADYRFIIRAALNVARAVGKVHQTGCVIGDLNHSGVLVARDARVALIDADSFQFRLGQKTYPCVVGVPDFLPPELHGVNLSRVIRSVEHDNFGLAVAIFLLLFMGRHPYSGRYLGPDLSIGQAIAQYKFAFSLNRQSSTGTSPPPGSLTLDVFPAPVRQAFESAFGLNPMERPSASSWIRVLTTLGRLVEPVQKVQDALLSRQCQSLPVVPFGTEWWWVRHVPRHVERRTGLSRRFAGDRTGDQRDPRAAFSNFGGSDSEVDDIGAKGQ